MQPKKVKSILIQYINEYAQMILSFYESLSTREREQIGSIKDWQARELVIHMGEWNKLLNQALHAILNLETPYLEEDYLAFNDQKYLETHGQSWEKTLAEVQEITRDAQEILNSLSDDMLLDPEAPYIFPR